MEMENKQTHIYSKDLKTLFKATFFISEPMEVTDLDFTDLL